MLHHSHPQSGGVYVLSHLQSGGVYMLSHLQSGGVYVLSHLQSGGVYVLSNAHGCDGERTYYDGCCMIAVNGEMVCQGAQFTIKDVVGH